MSITITSPLSLALMLIYPILASSSPTPKMQLLHQLSFSYLNCSPTCVDIDFVTSSMDLIPDQLSIRFNLDIAETEKTMARRELSQKGYFSFCSQCSNNTSNMHSTEHKIAMCIIIGLSLGHVIQLKLTKKLKIKLQCCQLLFSVEYITYNDIHLRPIKCIIPFQLIVSAKSMRE